MKSFKTELIVGSLLFITLAIVAINQFSTRRITIKSDKNWNVTTSSDGFEGGESSSEVQKTDAGFEMKFDVRDRHNTPYAVICLSPQTDKVFDLTWVQRFRLKLQTSGNPGSHLLFQVRTIEPGVSNETDFVSRKYNEVPIAISNLEQEIVVDRDDFHVPSWWLERYGRFGASARTNFRHVEWFEFATTTREGNGQLVISNISAEGHWVPPALLNQRLLWMWLVFSFGILASRIHDMRLELKRKRQLEKQLLQSNDQLSLESKEYSEMARRDALTGVLNRHGIDQVIKEVRNKNNSEDATYSVILFDLDHFKTINDKFGHLYGDEVLCDIANLVSCRLRGTDSVARWGGDEFLIVLPDTVQEKASLLAEDLRREFAQSHLEYTCTFGVCQSDLLETFDQTLQRADAALYSSKKKGRDAVGIPERDTGTIAEDAVIIMPTFSKEIGQTDQPVCDPF